MGIGVPKSTLESSPSNANSPSTRAGLLYPSVPKKTLASTRAGPPPKKPSSSSMDGGLGRDGGRRGGRGRDRNSRPSREVKLVHLLALCTGFFLAYTCVSFALGLSRSQWRAEWSPRLFGSAPPRNTTLFPIFVYGPSNQAIAWRIADETASASGRRLVGGTLVPHYTQRRLARARKWGEVFACPRHDAEWQGEHMIEALLLPKLYESRKARYDSYVGAALKHWGINHTALEVIQYESQDNLVSILQRLRLQSVAVLFEYPELEQIGSVRSYCTLVERPYMQVARDLRKAILLDGVSEGGDDTVLFAVHARAGGDTLNTDRCERDWGNAGKYERCIFWGWPAQLDLGTLSPANFACVVTKHINEERLKRSKALNVATILLTAPFMNKNATEDVRAALNTTTLNVSNWLEDNWSNYSELAMDPLDASLVDQALGVVADYFICSPLSSYSAMMRIMRGGDSICIGDSLRHVKDCST